MKVAMGRKMGRMLICLAVIIFVNGCIEESKEYRVYYDEETGQWVVDNPESDATWLKCNIGQNWSQDKEECDGEPTQLSYLEALEACPEGYTLPSNADFATILCNYSSGRSECNGSAGYDTCEQCTICKGMFPEITDDNYYASYYTSDTYWIEELERYRCFNYDLWMGCIWEYTIIGNEETKSVRCLKEKDSISDSGL